VPLDVVDTAAHCSKELSGLAVAIIYKFLLEYICP